MLSLERFAAIRAAIEAQEARDQVLEAEGLLVADWIASERRWLGALAAEVAEGGTELATRYLAAFLAAYPAVKPPAPNTAPGVAPPRALPSYLANDPARVVPPAAVAISHLPDVDQTLAPVSASVRRPALPFAKGDAAQRAPSPANWAPAEPSGETLPISSGSVAAAATPFAPPALDGWTVEKYAAFVADRRALGIDGIRQHYGVADDAVEQRVAAHFNQLLAADAVLRNRWIALVAQRTAEHRSR